MTAKKRKNAVFIIVVILLIAAISAIFGRIAFDRMHRQWLLSNHPLEFTEFVERSAAEYNLDPLLIYAIIKTESSFRHDAVSSAGARGLMQIMEETFDWLCFRLGEEREYSEMFDPETNIRYGSYLINFLLERYDYVLNTAIAAYHAGLGDVGRWLEDSEFSDDGRTLKYIPIPATRHYVNKINDAYDTYKMLYAG
jgi:soluble lytic murein transglycosylase